MMVLFYIGVALLIVGIVMQYSPSQLGFIPLGYQIFAIQFIYFGAALVAVFVFNRLWFRWRVRGASLTDPFLRVELFVSKTPEEVQDAIEQAMGILKAKTKKQLINLDDWSYWIARKAMTWKTFGERLDVLWSAHDSGSDAPLTRVLLASTPSLTTTVCDWGSATKNIQVFKQALGPEAPPQ